MDVKKMCFIKKQYDKKTAQTVKNVLLKKGVQYLRIYHCPICNNWHLTSKKNNKPNGKRNKIKEEYYEED